MFALRQASRTIARSAAGAPRFNAVAAPSRILSRTLVSESSLERCDDELDPLRADLCDSDTQ